MVQTRRLNAPERKLLRMVQESPRITVNGRYLRMAQRLEEMGLLRIVSAERTNNRVTGSKDWEVVLE